MKVFNWVHRRFLNANSCTSFVEEHEREKGGASSKVENEKHVLLEHDAHMVVEMLDHWKDGILSIGTLAINPLEEANIVMVNDDGNNNDDGDGDGDDNVDVMMNKYNNNYDIELADDHDHDHDDGDDVDGGEATPLMNNVEFFSHELEKVIIGANHEITEEDDDEGEIKKRVTLAELFMEEDFDSQYPLKVLKEINNKDDTYVIKDGINNINDNKKGIEMIMMKPNSLAKTGFSNAKKLLKKDLQPLKKFNKLMKRMMKKKIHPDMEAKMQKDMQVMPRCCLSNPINDHDNASNNEFASLLITQDGTV